MTRENQVTEAVLRHLDAREPSMEAEVRELVARMSPAELVEQGLGQLCRRVARRFELNRRRV